MKSVENVFNYFKDMCFGDKGIGEKVQMWSFKRTFRMGSKFLPLTNAGLEKKSATGLCVPSRTFRSAPLSTQLLVFRNKFERENSHDP